MKDIIEEWEKIPPEIIDKCIYTFKPKLRCVIEVERRQLIIINNSKRYTQKCICKIWFDFDQSKKVMTIPLNVSLFCSLQ